MMKKKNPYKDAYSEKGLWKKLREFAKAAGTKVVYAALLLFYAYQRNETPTWAKNIVLGALGYFIAPLDALPDLTPILGYTDDLGVLSFGLVTISAYVDQGVKDNARARINKWFKDVKEEDIRAVEDRL